MVDYLEIDGSQGEGGGQILRTSFALAALKGQPIRISKIRAGRPKPGLAAQHLTSIEAAAELCGGGLEGAHLGAKEVTFTPTQPAIGGKYYFRVGTAGSASLVAQTVLWPLCFADQPSQVTIEGGTHVMKAPPFEFLAETFLPAMRRLGVQASIRLDRHGFYPAGGGKIVLDIEPVKELRPAQWMTRGRRTQLTGHVLLARLPDRIGETQANALGRHLQLAGKDRHVQVIRESNGPGNAVLVRGQYEHGTIIVSAMGKREVPAEEVAKQAAREFKAFNEGGQPVDEHLADQLIIPLALAGGGSFCTGPLSLHATTNITVVQKFLDASINVTPTEGDAVCVTFSRN